jgi:hypothetical protein
MADSCEHKHTRLNGCDDCGQPWCWICKTYHKPEAATLVCVDKLHAEIARLKGILDEHVEVYLGAKAILDAELARTGVVMMKVIV